MATEFARTYSSAPSEWITHVGIYVGGGRMLNAPVEGDVIREMPVFTGFWGAHYTGAGRVGGSAHVRVGVSQEPKVALATIEAWLRRLGEAGAERSALGNPVRPVKRRSA
ncbi:MAG TPA: NlpC/P60 family protein [Chloroflexota bacterium]|jgi:hypothetical protein